MYSSHNNTQSALLTIHRGKGKRKAADEAAADQESDDDKLSKDEVVDKLKDTKKKAKKDEGYVQLR